MTGPKRMRPESAEADPELTVSYVVEPERRMSELSVDRPQSAVTTGRRSARGNWHNRLRIGIMGGSFNPIHDRHMEIAACAKREHKLDRVIFLPAGNPPHKHEGLADAEYRFEMTRLAVSGMQGFSVSRMEIDREGVTYTVDTLTRLAAPGRRGPRAGVAGAPLSAPGGGSRSPGRALGAVYDAQRQTGCAQGKLPGAVLRRGAYMACAAACGARGTRPVQPACGYDPA